MTSPVVTGFNYMAGCVGRVWNDGSSFKKNVNWLVEKVPGAKGSEFKAVVVKPVALLGVALTFFDKADRHTALGHMASEISLFKRLMGGLEVITKFPSMLNAISDPDWQRRDGAACETRKYNATDGSVYSGPKLTHTEAVFKKISVVAGWFLGIPDAICSIRSWRSTLPKVFDKVTPLIPILAGGYVGAQGFYEEWRYSEVTWKGGEGCELATTKEKMYGCIRLTTNAAYCLLSFIGAIGLYHGQEGSKWVGRCQFAAQVATTVLPIVQAGAQWMIEPPEDKEKVL